MVNGRRAETTSPDSERASIETTYGVDDESPVKTTSCTSPCRADSAQRSARIPVGPHVTRPVEGAVVCQVTVVENGPSAETPALETTNAAGGAGTGDVVAGVVVSVGVEPGCD